MRILFLSSEVVPYAKTGGLADVSGALPAALRAAGQEVITITPLHPGTAADLHPLGGIRRFDMSGQTIEWRGWTDPSTSTVFIDSPQLFAQPGIYTDEPDEPFRWAAFQHLALIAAAASKRRFDVIHANDWQTGLVPLLTTTVYRDAPKVGLVPTVLTIHNLGYQGRFGSEVVEGLGLGSARSGLHQDHLAQGHVSFLETGLLHANKITTVSPTYAREIQTPDGGAGLDGVLGRRSADIVGILNGIDTDEWNPRTDRHIPWRYSEKSLWRKEKDKEALLGRLQLPYHKHVPVLGLVSRLAHQKGMDIMGGPLLHFLDTWDIRLAVLGSGQPDYESFFHRLTRMNPDKVAFVRGYDIELSHLIEAGADIFLMPSLYEPCGLNQMYSLAYGTLPVVRKVGGLADTVTPIEGDTGNGFVFEHYTEDGLGWALGKALELHIDRPAWKAAQIRAMAADHSWEHRTGDYLDLYRGLLTG